MRGRRVRLVACGIAIVFGCSSPTGLCGCPPSRATVVVVGTLQDASGTTVARARLLLDALLAAHPDTLPPLVVGQGDALTDTAGAFRVVVYSVSGGVLGVRVALVQPDGTHLELATSAATFKSEDDRPDTLRLALRSP